MAGGIIASAGPLAAEFSYSSAKSSGGFGAELVFDARTDTAAEGGEFILLPPEMAEELGVDRISAPDRAGDRLVESCLIAIPGLTEFNADEWDVSAEVVSFADGSSGDGADASAAVTFEYIVMGTISGLQVTVDPRNVGGGNPAQSIRISLSGPGGDIAALPKTAVADLGTEASELLSIFINGEEVDHIPLNHQTTEKSAKAAPALPGNYRVTYAPGNEIIRVPLGTVALSSDNIHTARLDYHGTLIPAGGALGGDLWFYGPRRVTPWDRSDSVFVTGGHGAPSPTLLQRDAFQTLAPKNSESATRHTITYSEKTQYDRYMAKPIGSRFAINMLNSGQQTTLTIPMPTHLTDSNIEVRALVYGRTSGNLNPDHHADFTLQGVALPRASWFGRRLVEHSATVAVPGLPRNSVSFVHRIPNNSPFDGTLDQQNLDEVHLTVTGLARAGGSKMLLQLSEGPNSNPRHVSVGGLPGGTNPGDVIVLNVSNPTAPVRLVNVTTFPDGAGGSAVEFEASSDGATYFVQTTGSMQRINGIGAEQVPGGPGGTLTNIFVRQPELASALAPFVGHRGGSGISVELDPQAAYNAFNGGQESPEAIRKAIENIIQNSGGRVTLPYVYLVGHATMDPANHLNLPRDPYIPVFMEESVPLAAGSIEINVDYPYGLVVGNDRMLDAAVSRFPVKNAGELNQIISRQVNYDNSAKPNLRSTNRPIVFVTDNPTGGPDFVPEVANLQQKWQNFGGATQRIDLPAGASNGDGARAALTTAMQSGSGAGMVVYTGHGNFDIWANERIVRTSDVPGIDTINKWPVIATFTCLNSYFAFPGAEVRALGEAWLISTNRGATASLAPTSIDYWEDQNRFAHEFFDTMIGQPHERRVGRVMALAMNSFVTKFPALDKTVRTFMMFGDPATVMTIDPKSGDPTDPTTNTPVTPTPNPDPDGLTLPTMWFLAEGATHSLFETYYLLANPNSTDMQVEVEYLPESGAGQTNVVTLAANSRHTIKANDIIPNTGLSATFKSLDGKGFAVERAMYAMGPNSRWYGAHATVGIPEPKAEWFLAEGATSKAGPADSNFQTFVLLANPHSFGVDVTLTFFPEGGSPFDFGINVPAKRRVTVEPGTIDGRLNNTSFSTRVRSNGGQGILVERAMWWRASNWPAGSPFMEGTASPGLPDLSTTWFIAEGNTAGFDDFILLVNPNGSPASVNIRYLMEGGDPIDRALVVGANQRRTINVRWDAEGIQAEAKHGAVITSSVPIAMERSMYFSGSGYGWVGGHNSIGSRSLSTKWLMPEGATVPVAVGKLRTEILMANPNSIPASAEVRFLLGGGGVHTENITIPAQRRVTLVANDIPALNDKAFSTLVVSSEAIVVERSMYFAGDTPASINPIGGTASLGIPAGPLSFAPKGLEQELFRDVVPQIVPWPIGEMPTVTPSPTLTPTPTIPTVIEP